MNRGSAPESTLLRQTQGLQGADDAGDGAGALVPVLEVPRGTGPVDDERQGRDCTVNGRPRRRRALGQLVGIEPLGR